MEDDNNFAKTLRQESFAFQQKRHDFRLRKLSFVAALFGLGSAHLGNLTFAPILYLIPIVSFLFDTHILMEDHAVKRIGAFLGQQESSASSLERNWEKYVKEYPSPFSAYASPLVTLLVLGGTAIMLWIGDADPLLFWFWLFANLVANVGLMAYWTRLRKKFRKK